jgi:hypothetical protein
MLHGDHIDNKANEEISTTIDTKWQGGEELGITLDKDN